MPKTKKIPNKRFQKKFKKDTFDVGINMKEANIIVLNSQENIARAKRAGNLQLAEELAGDLLRSFEARAIAVQTVVSNKGIRSPGLSKESLNTNVKYLEMIDHLLEIIENPAEYKATPLDRIYIPKPDGTKRPLSIPSYLDRCLQALYKLAIEPITEEMADMSSYGFRPIRNVSWAVARTQNLLSNPIAKYEYIVELDIQGCFDNIDQTFLSHVTPIIPKTILWQWFQCGYVDRDNRELYETDRGVPQGGVISPTFANLALDGLEKYVKDEVLKAKTGSIGAAFCRYADDMIFATTTYNNAVIALAAVKEFLAIRGLKVKEAKTRIVDMSIPNSNFDFLGFNFKKVYRRNRKRLVVRTGIPLKAIRKLKEKIRNLTRKPLLFHIYIDKTNDIVRGWANAYRIAHNSMYVYRGLRYWLWKQAYKKAYKFTKQKFDKANHTEIHERVMSNYFTNYKSYKTWPQVRDKNGVLHILMDISETSYVNAVFTNKAANPYIMEDRDTIDKVNLSLKRTWKEVVLEKSSACCGLCGRRIDINFIPYELHHILPKRFGGTDRPSNMVVLCKVPCHLEVSTAVRTRNVYDIFKFVASGVLEIPEEYLNNIIENPTSE